MGKARESMYPHAIERQEKARQLAHTAATRQRRTAMARVPERAVVPATVLVQR